MSKQSEKIRNKEYIYAPELETLAKKVIEEKDLPTNPARIKYILVYPNISKKTAGKCIRCSNELKFLGDCDYIVEMSGDLWEQLDEETQYILMWHELKHILVTVNDKTGENEFRMLDHDVQDFYSIIKAHGIDWFTNLKTMAASVYDLDPNDLDGFSI